MVSRLCLPHSLNSLCHTNIIRLELVQSDGCGEGEDTEEPVAERAGLGHTLLGEVVDDRCPVLNVSQSIALYSVSSRWRGHTGIQCESGEPKPSTAQRP